MDDSELPNAATSYRLPPGFSFHPSDEQLICHYLASRNSNLPRFGTDVIKEIDLYIYDPFDLPETACFRFGKGGRRRHWYFYVGRADVERRRRAARNGYWKKREGRVRDVVRAGAGEAAVGTRKSFVFYLSNGKGKKRTNWIMYEYALVGHPKASFVLCRVLAKSDHRNSFLDFEYSVVTVRNAKLLEDSAVDKEDEIQNFASGEASVFEDQIINEPVSHQTKPFKNVTWPGSMFDGLSAQKLVAILEENFIELDDLACSNEEIA